MLERFGEATMKKVDKDDGQQELQRDLSSGGEGLGAFSK